MLIQGRGASRSEGGVRELSEPARTARAGAGCRGPDDAICCLGMRPDVDAARVGETFPPVTAPPTWPRPGGPALSRPLCSHHASPLSGSQRPRSADLSPSPVASSSRRPGAVGDQRARTGRKDSRRRSVYTQGSATLGQGRETAQEGGSARSSGHRRSGGANKPSGDELPEGLSNRPPHSGAPGSPVVLRFTRPFLAPFSPGFSPANSPHFRQLLRPPAHPLAQAARGSARCVCSGMRAVERAPSHTLVSVTDAREG